MAGGGGTCDDVSVQGAKSKCDGVTDLFWTGRHMWNNDGDTAVVVDGEGGVVATVVEKGAPAPKGKKGSKKRKASTADMEDDDAAAEEEGAAEEEAGAGSGGAAAASEDAGLRRCVPHRL